MKRERERYVKAAQDIYTTDDIEIDDVAQLSEADDCGGAWVAAWVWVNDAEADPAYGCTCEACWPLSFKDPASMRMIVCSICGNKRCPHATDHRNPCTNSNEPGQPGSSYAAYVRPDLDPQTDSNQEGC